MTRLKEFLRALGRGTPAYTTGAPVRPAARWHWVVLSGPHDGAVIQVELTDAQADTVRWIAEGLSAAAEDRGMDTSVAVKEVDPQ